MRSARSFTTRRQLKIEHQTVVQNINIAGAAAGSGAVPRRIHEEDPGNALCKAFPGFCFSFFSDFAQ